MISSDRLRILDRWDRSGLSSAAFAPSVGVSAWTLYSWRRQVRLAEGVGQFFMTAGASVLGDC